MGRAKRGQVSAIAQTGAQARREGNSSRQATIDALGFGSILAPKADSKLVRSVSTTTFTEDLQQWKDDQHAFVEGARAELEADMQRFATTGQWGKFMEMYSRSTDYSPLNSYWARMQLRAKWDKLIDSGTVSAEELGDPADGRIMSKSAWKAMGGSVKEGFFKTSKGFDERFHAEMSKPMGFNGFFTDDIGKDGKVILKKDGTPKQKFVKTTVKAFGTFDAYAQDAIVDKEGNPFKMPDMPWDNASGSEESGENLMRDMKTAYAELGLNMVFENRNDQGEASKGQVRLPEHAVYDKNTSTVTIDSAQPIQEQAVAALRGLASHVGEAPRPTKDSDTAERYRKIDRASAESAKYVIASLYGLQTDTQTFPHLLELARDSDQGKKNVSQIASNTHRRVTSILAHLDPVVKAKVKSASEGRTKTRSAAGRGRTKAKARTAKAKA